jgi:RNA polymerase sigma-70 factor (sigma-E family)
MTIGDCDAGDIRDDSCLAPAFDQVTGQQTAWYAHAYDLEAGLTRFTAWLDEHTAAASAPARGRRYQISHADEAVTQLYSNHYRSLVRLAGLLVRDEPTAEEVVQECFIAMHDGWGNLRDDDKALSYLKQAVVNRSRSVLRHRSVTDRNAPKPGPDMPSTEQGSITLIERSVVISALRSLPDRQRQALVLRYYANLSEAQIAEMMGISKGAVKSHTARGMSSLRAVLEQAG